MCVNEYFIFHIKTKTVSLVLLKDIILYVVVVLIFVVFFVGDVDVFIIFFQQAIRQRTGLGQVNGRNECLVESAINAAIFSRDIFLNLETK